MSRRSGRRLVCILPIRRFVPDPDIFSEAENRILTTIPKLLRILLLEKDSFPADIPSEVIFGEASVPSAEDEDGKYRSPLPVENELSGSSGCRGPVNPGNQRQTAR